MDRRTTSTTSAAPSKVHQHLFTYRTAGLCNTNVTEYDDVLHTNSATAVGQADCSVQSKSSSSLVAARPAGDVTLDAYGMRAERRREYIPYVDRSDADEQEEHELPLEDEDGERVSYSLYNSVSPPTPSQSLSPTVTQNVLSLPPNSDAFHESSCAAGDGVASVDDDDTAIAAVQARCYSANSIHVFDYENDNGSGNTDKSDKVDGKSNNNNNSNNKNSSNDARTSSQTIKRRNTVLCNATHRASSGRQDGRSCTVISSNSSSSCASFHRCADRLRVARPAAARGSVADAPSAPGMHSATRSRLGKPSTMSRRPTHTTNIIHGTSTTSMRDGTYRNEHGTVHGRKTDRMWNTRQTTHSCGSAYAHIGSVVSDYCANRISFLEAAYRAARTSPRRHLYASSVTQAQTRTGTRLQSTQGSLPHARHSCDGIGLERRYTRRDSYEQADAAIHDRLVSLETTAYDAVDVSTCTTTTSLRTASLSSSQPPCQVRYPARAAETDNPISRNSSNEEARNVSTSEEGGLGGTTALYVMSMPRSQRRNTSCVTQDLHHGWARNVARLLSPARCGGVSPARAAAICRRRRVSRTRLQGKEQHRGVSKRTSNDIRSRDNGDNGVDSIRYVKDVDVRVYDNVNTFITKDDNSDSCRNSACDLLTHDVVYKERETWGTSTHTPHDAVHVPSLLLSNNHTCALRRAVTAPRLVPQGAQGISARHRSTHTSPRLQHHSRGATVSSNSSSRCNGVMQVATRDEAIAVVAAESASMTTDRRPGLPTARSRSARQPFYVPRRISPPPEEYAIHRSAADPTALLMRSDHRRGAPVKPHAARTMSRMRLVAGTRSARSPRGRTAPSSSISDSGNSKTKDSSASRTPRGDANNDSHGDNCSENHINSVSVTSSRHWMACGGPTGKVRHSVSTTVPATRSHFTSSARKEGKLRAVTQHKEDVMSATAALRAVCWSRVQNNNPRMTSGHATDSAMGRASPQAAVQTRSSFRSRLLFDVALPCLNINKS